jgi:2-oxoglutarate dehydrogenase E2 component (dihydrolipoamide succinyltransferase)
MPTTVTMPQLGETVVEGTILKWLKQEGEEIDRDEPLFEISTDKVDTEVPSPVAGTIQKILVPEGETVSVGTELAQIDDGSQGEQKVEVQGDAEEAASSDGGSAGAADTPARAEAEPEEEERAREAQEPQREIPETDQPEPTPEPDRREGGVAPAPPEPKEDRAAARASGNGGERSHILSPLVRRLAEENEIDLSSVQGSGTGGRITKRDIMAFIESGGVAETAEAPAAATQPEAATEAPPRLQTVPEPAPQERPAAPAPAAASAREEAVPLTHIRKAIAKHMLGSLQTSARAWNLVEVNMENVAQLRARAKDAFKQREGLSLTFMPFVARAVCDALLAFPDVNSELRDDQIIRKRYVNLGVAVAYEEGLIVPVVKDADGMNIVGLARAVNDVAVRARSRKLKPDEVHGGTFTITNPGPFGSIISVPIINQPQCGILALDAIEKRPVVIDDAIAIRHMVYLSMSWDHRIIDGAVAAQFLGRLKENLQTWDFGPELSSYLP